MIVGLLLFVSPYFSLYIFLSVCFFFLFQFLPLFSLSSPTPKHFVHLSLEMIL